MKIGPTIIGPLMVVALVSLAWPTRLSAQDDITTQLWTYYRQSWTWKPKWEPFGDAAYKIRLDEVNWMQWQVFPSVRYLANATVDLRGGVGLIYTGQENAVNTLEIRPYQGTRLTWPRLERFDFYHLIRLEERFLFQTGAKPSASLRLRYKLGTVIPIGDVIEHITGYNRTSIPLSIEIFFDGGGIEEQFGSRLRISAGFAYVFSATWSTDINLIVQESRSTDTGDFTTSDIIFQVDLRRRRPALAH